MRPLLFVFLLALASSRLHAQGGSAIIGLALPPPGGDGYSALQAGAAVPEGAASLYHNPALLAELERAKGSQLFWTDSRQNLLPQLGLPDLYQDYWAAAAVFPDPESGTDMGVGIFRNHVSFGKNEQTDGDGNVIAQFDSYETVYGLGVAVRLGIPVSIGVTAKYFDSDLASGLANTQDAIGWAFDLGMVANPRLVPSARMHWPAIAVTPSLALTVRNLGPDVFYAEAYEADPIPTTYSMAYAFKIEACDLADFTGGSDMDHEWTSRSTSWDQVRMLGYSYSLLGFRFGAGWLDDPSGNRFEKHTFRALDLNGLQLYRIWQRIARRDFTSPSRSFDAGYCFRGTTVWGVPFRANPRLVIGFRKISSRGDGIREGQKAYYVGISL